MHTLRYFFGYLIEHHISDLINIVYMTLLNSLSYLPGDHLARVACVSTRMQSIVSKAVLSSIPAESQNDAVWNEWLKRVSAIHWRTTRSRIRSVPKAVQDMQYFNTDPSVPLKDISKALPRFDMFRLWWMVFACATMRRRGDNIRTFMGKLRRNMHRIYTGAKKSTCTTCKWTMPTSNMYNRYDCQWCTDVKRGLITKILSIGHPSQKITGGKESLGLSGGQCTSEVAEGGFSRRSLGSPQARTACRSFVDVARQLARLRGMRW